MMALFSDRNGTDTLEESAPFLIEGDDPLTRNEVAQGPVEEIGVEWGGKEDPSIVVPIVHRSNDEELVRVKRIACA
jgi:hypothetical protein